MCFIRVSCMILTSFTRHMAIFFTWLRRGHAQLPFFPILNSPPMVQPTYNIIRRALLFLFSPSPNQIFSFAFLCSLFLDLIYTCLIMAYKTHFPLLLLFFIINILLALAGEASAGRKGISQFETSGVFGWFWRQYAHSRYWACNVAT